MNIVVCCKVVPDDQDIQVAADGTLDYSKAKPIVSAYDLNAIEAAAQLADGGRVVAVTAGPADIDDSKLKKNILARGVDELYMTADDACKGLDAHAAAAALADLVAKAGEYDLILCGDGSADDYAQQVDVQLADALGLPVVTAVSAVSVEGAVATCDRMLETQLQTVQVDLPAVISVVPDIALPRIPGMKDILAAGYDGVMLSNGPGDPTDNVDQIAEIAKLFGRIPMFGICLGHQLMALAQGGSTVKLKYGHRGVNQPARDVCGTRTFLTSQNHGYAVVPESVKTGVIRYINANDGTCEGVDYPDLRAFSVQFHPEACSGPHDTAFLFDRFCDLMGGAHHAD